MLDFTQDTESQEDDEKLFLPVKAIEQSKPWDCGPTALRIVLKYQFGLKFSASDMIFLCGATKSGSDELNLIKALDALGFKYTQTDSGRFNHIKRALQMGQVPIVHLVMEDGGGHYMVVQGYDEDKQEVYLSDPATGKTLTYGIPYFVGIWKEEEKETQTRWMLVVTGYGGDRMGSMINRLKRIQKKVVSSRK
jgi:predicted double-glycine peptidase